MKLKEIARQFDLDPVDFERFLRTINAGKAGVFNYELDETQVSSAIAKYRAYLVEKDRRAVEEKLLEEAESLHIDPHIMPKLASILTSVSHFCGGYHQVGQSTIISADDSLYIDRGNLSGDFLQEQLPQLRRRVVMKLQAAAHKLGCNAVTDIQFSYIPFDCQRSGWLERDRTIYEPYLLCITATGNAVHLAKED